ncbi:hypothetical protein [uncultured Brachyspira sp.]|uniref:hypothetical protein n=1 Tax=uncultured Brachyspira sp. TaxID=221953 RepID=UPI0026032FA8|nr:hypothetical protein [uncultured Brachyspira sp.]
MAENEKLNSILENLDYKTLFDNLLEIDGMLEEDIVLDDIASENLFVLSFELLEHIKANPSNYNIMDIDNDEKVKAISRIIRKMELYFIEF